MNILIETWVGCRCGKLLLWSLYLLHNQDSVCRLGTGIFISCGDGPVCIRTGWQNWTLQEIFWFTNMFGRRTQAITTACFERVHQFLCATSTRKQVDQFNGWSASMVLQNMKTRARKHGVRHNFQRDKNTTLLVWLSPPSPPGVYGLTMGWQRSVADRLTDWFCVEP